MHRRDFLKSTAFVSIHLSAAPLPVGVFYHTNESWKGKKILFLGDSITQAGSYINFMESALLAAKGRISAQLLNLGLASETISGLSEAAHPFPRPFLHDRLEKVLAYTQPDIIFACYGINCGIYHPFDQALFRQYQHGIDRLMQAAERQKAELILMTPPPYAAPVSNYDTARKDKGREDYSFMRPYLAYDDVMKKYGEWIMSLENKLKVIDLHTPMLLHQSVCYDEDYIHPNEYGHQLMAQTILHALDWLDIQENTRIRMEGAIPETTDALSSTIELNLPNVPYLKYTKAEVYNNLIAFPEITLVIRNCPSGVFQLMDQDQIVGQYTGDSLRNGITISTATMGDSLQKLAPWHNASQIYDLVAARRKLYDYSLLQHIGHQRPMSQEGLPLNIAEQKKQDIDEKIRRKMTEKKWLLELIKVG